MADKSKTDSAATGEKGAKTNEPYLVLARKYRPLDFTSLVGQEAMVQTLGNAFKSGRIHHAFVLTGVRGVGKTTTARILARAFNYVGAQGAGPTLDLSKPGEHCEAIIEGRHVDVMEMDAASNTSIDDIREIIDSVKYGPVSAPYKVYIIDEVHMLSKQAFNGLLKTLEEPPPYVKFIFATTEIRKVPVTILSRCQRFDLRRISAEKMTAYLQTLLEKEGLAAEPEALAMIVRAGEGSARDSLSLLDQAIAYDNGDISVQSVQSMLGLADRGRIIDLFEKLVSGEVGPALEDLRTLYDVGAEPHAIVADLANFTHAITRMKLIAAAADDPALTPLERTSGADFAAKLDLRSLTRIWQILQKGLEEILRAQNAIQTAEMVLIRIGYAADLPTPDELIAKINEEAKSAPHAPASSAGTSGSPTANGPTNGSTNGAPSGRSASYRNGALAIASRTLDPQPAAQPEHRQEPWQDFSQEQSQNADPNTVDTKTVDPRSFAELVVIASKKRDVVVKNALENDVRVARFEQGRIDIGLTEGADRSVVQMLSAKLKEWTGRNWLISVTGEAVATPTLREQAEAEKKREEQRAHQEPMVRAVMDMFSGARIVDVEILKTSTSEQVDLNDQQDSDEDSEE